MTNKEAIEILNKGYPDINKYAVSEQEQYDGDIQDYEEALKLAIKALEKRPQGDFISREALKEKLKERYYNDGLNIVTAMELIDNEPAIIIGVDLSELPDYTGTPYNSYVNKEA